MAIGAPRSETNRVSTSTTLRALESRSSLKRKTFSREDVDDRQQSKRSRLLTHQAIVHKVHAPNVVGLDDRGAHALRGGTPPELASFRPYSRHLGGKGERCAGRSRAVRRPQQDMEATLAIPYTSGREVLDSPEQDLIHDITPGAILQRGSIETQRLGKTALAHTVLFVRFGGQSPSLGRLESF